MEPLSGLSHERPFCQWSDHVGAVSSRLDHALMIAAYFGHDDMVDVLIKANAAIDAENSNGDTAADYALQDDADWAVDSDSPT